MEVFKISISLSNLDIDGLDVSAKGPLDLRCAVITGFMGFRALGFQ